MISLYAPRIHTTYFAVISAPVNIFKGKLSGQETFIAREEVGGKWGCGIIFGGTTCFSGKRSEDKSINCQSIANGQGGGGNLKTIAEPSGVIR